MKKTTTAITILILALLLFQPAAAQAPSRTLFLDTLDAQAFPEIELHLSAWDENGLPLDNLQREDFQISEDGGDALTPSLLVIDRQAPLRIVLAIDVSDSMRGAPLDDARAAAARFLDRLDPAKDQAALLAFSSPLDADPETLDPQRETGFTNEMTRLYDLVEGLQAGGQTQLYDAAAKAAALFRDQPAGHRAVLLLSDGRNEPAETGDPDQAVALARELNVPFFIIGLGDQVDQVYLQRLAFETGGLFLPVPRSAELAGMFNRMATLLKTSYRLVYTSALPADGASHELAVRLEVDSVSSQVLAQIQAPFIPTAPPPSETPIPPADTPIPPSETPVPPSETPLPPTPEPSSTPLPPPSTAPMPVCGSPFESLACFSGSIFAWILGLLALATVLWLVFRPRRKPQPEACAKCGYDLTGKTGPCPQCGSEKRLPVIKRK